MAQAVDVIIVGGGMVGATLAGLLGQSGRRVLVVEETASTPSTDTQGAPDLRVSSVNRASASVFDQIGAWDSMLARRACPFRRVRVWDTAGEEACFEAAEAGYDCLGWFIENAFILDALYEAVRDLPTVDWLAPASPQSLTFGSESARLTLDDGMRVEAPLIVGADGPRSTIRTMAGVDSHQTDYGQRALVTNVRTALPQQDTTWQYFARAGPQAFLPLAGPNASLIWYDEPDAVRDREALDDADLATAISEAFPSALGGIEAIHARASFPIRRQHAVSYTRPRLALVGDAAHVIHPLMGQGLNLGIQGVATLASGLTASPEHDPGSVATLARYERRHRPNALALMMATGGCHRLFTQDGGLLPRVGRGLLGLAARAPVARRRAMRLAMGLPLAGD